MADHARQPAPDQYLAARCVAALLFPREDLFWVDRLAALQTSGLERLPGGIIGPIPPRQFSLDPACHRLAERAAEIERPQTVRHHLGRDAMEVKSLA
jgi:hypothetical protein